MKPEEWIRDPVFQLNLLLWMSHDQPDEAYPKEENETLAETAQVTQIKRHEHAGGLDFASPCG
jgi:hypothetical protein